MMEVVFEGVPDKSFDCLVNLIVGGTGVSLYHSELGVIDKLPLSGRYIEFLRSRRASPSLFIRPESIKAGDVLIRSSLVRLLSIDGVGEISINFSADDILCSDGVDVMRELASWCAKLAGVSGIEAYCCGLEPAVDKDTQFFSQEGNGPIKYSAGKN